jgi:hypothetical protein
MEEAMSARNFPSGTSAMGVELMRAGSPAKGSTVCPVSTTGAVAHEAARQRSMGRILLTIISDEVDAVFFPEP